MHLKILFIFCILATVANVSFSAPASPNFSQQSTRPITPDDIVGQKNKSQKLADGPGIKQDTISQSKSIKKTPKELGQRSFSVRENAIKTPLPSLRALLKPFRSCSSPSASNVHLPTTRKDKGKAPASSSSQ